MQVCPHLPGFSRGLDVRDTVGPGQFLGLPGFYRAHRKVTLVPHQHHGDVVRVLHPLDLLPASTRHRLQEPTPRPRRDAAALARVSRTLGRSTSAAQHCQGEGGSITSSLQLKREEAQSSVFINTEHPL